MRETTSPRNYEYPRFKLSPKDIEKYSPWESMQEQFEVYSKRWLKNLYDKKESAMRIVLEAQGMTNFKPPFSEADMSMVKRGRWEERPFGNGHIELFYFDEALMIEITFVGADYQFRLPDPEHAAAFEAGAERETPKQSPIK